MKRILIAAAVLAALPALAGTLIITGEAAKPASSGGAGGGSQPAGLAPTIQPQAVGKTWDVRSDDLNLANLFARWGKEAGYVVRWDARKNAMVEGPDRIAGSFEDALTFVLSGPGIASSAYPLEVCFYPNTPPLARITRKGDQDKECK